MDVDSMMPSHMPEGALQSGTPKITTRSHRHKKQGIAFSKPTLSKRELKSVLECMVQDEIHFGKVAVTMEREFANAFEFRHALCASSITSAYHLAYLAFELEASDEVILPTHAPVAALNALAYVDAKPVLVDIGRESFHPTVEEIKKKITAKTRAIVVHYAYGAYADYEELREYLASDEGKKHHQIRLIEDISYNAGVEYEGRLLGTDADIAIVGLENEMLMTAGKGAVLLTDSQKLYTIAKDLRVHGGDRPYKVRYDYSIPDYMAAMGLEQLSSLAQIIERRRKIGARYLEAIKTRVVSDHNKTENWFTNPQIDSYAAFPIVFSNSLDHVVNYFDSLHIEVRRTIGQGPLHQLMGEKAQDFPNAEKLYQRGLLLPLYPYLTKLNVERLIGAIKGFY